MITVIRLRGLSGEVSWTIFILWQWSLMDLSPSIIFRSSFSSSMERASLLSWKRSSRANQIMVVVEPGLRWHWGEIEIEYHRTISSPNYQDLPTQCLYQMSVWGVVKMTDNSIGFTVSLEKFSLWVIIELIEIENEWDERLDVSHAIRLHVFLGWIAWLAISQGNRRRKHSRWVKMIERVRTRWWGRIRVRSVTTLIAY